MGGFQNGAVHRSLYQGLWKLMHWKDRRPRPNKDVQSAAVYRFQQRHSNFFCGGHRSAGVSTGCLPQRPWGLFLMSPTPSPRTILEWVISGFRPGVNEIAALLAFYAA